MDTRLYQFDIDINGALALSAKKYPDIKYPDLNNTIQDIVETLFNGIIEVSNDTSIDGYTEHLIQCYLDKLTKMIDVSSKKDKELYLPNDKGIEYIYYLSYKIIEHLMLMNIFPLDKGQYKITLVQKHNVDMPYYLSQNYNVGNYWYFYKRIGD